MINYVDQYEINYNIWKLIRVNSGDVKRNSKSFKNLPLPFYNREEINVK